MKAIKLITAILTAAMLLVALAGCAHTNNGGTTTDAPAMSSIAETGAETAPSFCEANFEKSTFTVYGRGEKESSYPGFYIDVEDATDSMGQKTVERNALVEQKYNIIIEFIQEPNPYKNISRMIDSGDANFDLILDRRAYLSNLAQSGCLMDFNNIDYIDFSKPWWDANCARDYEVAGKLFFMANDISVSNLAGTRFIYFNKALIENYQLENPYDLVKANKWR